MFCKICSYPCLVRLLAPCGDHLGDLWEVWGFLGLPTSSFDIHQRVSARPLDAFDTHHNRRHNSATTTTRARMDTLAAWFECSTIQLVLQHIKTVLSCACFLAVRLSSPALRTNMRIPGKCAAGHSHTALLVHAKFGSTSPRAPLEAEGVPQAGQSHHDSTTACLTVCLYSTRDPREPGRNAEPR